MERNHLGLKQRSALESVSPLQKQFLQMHSRLTEAHRMFDVIAKINSAMVTAPCFKIFCTKVVSVLKDTFRFKYIQIWIQDSLNPKMLRLVTPDKNGNERVMPVSEGLVGKAIRTRTTVASDDVAHDPDYVDRHHEVKSELCIPLMCDRDVIGALNIETTHSNSFEKQLDVLHLIAENLGYAMKVTYLLETEKYFKSLVEQMNEGVWVGDSHEHTLYTNAVLQKMLGYSEKELQGKLSYDLVDADSGRIIRAQNIKRKRGEKSHYEATLLTKQGGRIPVVLHGVPFGVDGTMATITNLDEIRETKKELHKAQAFLAAVTQSSIDAIVGIDESLKIKSWNVGAERMYGYKAEEMIEKNTEILTPQELRDADELNTLVREARKKCFVRNHETMRLHKNGTIIDILLSMSVVRDTSNEIIGYSIFHKDITAEKKWQRELQGRFDKVQEAYRAVGLQRRYLDYLSEIILLALNPERSCEQLASFIVNGLTMISKADAVTLRLYHAESDKLELNAQTGVGNDWFGKKSIRYTGSLVEEAVLKGTPLKILDIIHHPKYSSPSLARKKNLRSALILPLVVRGKLLGSITIYLSNEKNLGLLDDEFIEIFSKQAACALSLCESGNGNKIAAKK